MRKSPKPKVHLLSNKDRRRAEKLRSEIHRRQKEMATIMDRYLKKKAETVFELPRPWGVRAKSKNITLKGFTFVISNRVVGVYDHDAGV